MNFNLEQFFFPEHIWAILLISLKLLLKFLDLNGQIIDNAAVIIGTAAMRCSKSRRYGLWWELERFIFVRRIRLLLKKRWINC